ncbi:MAG: hypothetical protein ACI9XO_001047 [Paraglaciecola sp.]|jgi:hypothetical protein
MNRNLKVFCAAILIASLFTQDEICKHLGFGQASFHNEVKELKSESEPVKTSGAHEDDYYTDETIYRWDEQLLDWVESEKKKAFQAKLVKHTTTNPSLSTLIEVEWKSLMDIEYKMRYFKELSTEMYAPIFNKAVRQLHKNEITIGGYVIPLDQEGKLMALSFYPYSSCFFCGKASPASVISMYVKDKEKFYEMDTYKEFKGVLHLNHDDPNEFYYVLRDAEEL